MATTTPVANLDQAVHLVEELLNSRRRARMLGMPLTVAITGVAITEAATTLAELAGDTLGDVYDAAHGRDGATANLAARIISTVVDAGLDPYAVL